MNYIAAIALWLALSGSLFGQIEMKDCINCLMEPQCPAGKVAWGGMASSSMIVERGCYTPEEKKATELAFAQNICEETASSSGSFGKNGDWLYIDAHEFRDGHCVETRTFTYITPHERRRIPVSEGTYMRGTCTDGFFNDDKGLRIYNRSEWKECLK